MPNSEVPWELYSKPLSLWKALFLFGFRTVSPGSIILSGAPEPSACMSCNTRLPGALWLRSMWMCGSVRDRAARSHCVNDHFQIPLRALAYSLGLRQPVYLCAIGELSRALDTLCPEYALSLVCSCNFRHSIPISYEAQCEKSSRNQVLSKLQRKRPGRR